MVAIPGRADDVLFHRPWRLAGDNRRPSAEHFGRPAGQAAAHPAPWPPIAASAHRFRQGILRLVPPVPDHLLVPRSMGTSMNRKVAPPRSAVDHSISRSSHHPAATPTSSARAAAGSPFNLADAVQVRSGRISAGTRHGRSQAGGNSRSHHLAPLGVERPLTSSVWDGRERGSGIRVAPAARQRNARATQRYRLLQGFTAETQRLERGISGQRRAAKLGLGLVFTVNEHERHLRHFRGGGRAGVRVFSGGPAFGPGACRSSGSRLSGCVGGFLR